MGNAAPRKATGRTTKATGRTTPKGTQPASFERLKAKKGLVRRLPVYLDSEVSDEFEAAKAEFDAVSSNDLLRKRHSAEELEAITARFQAATEAMAENTVTMVMGRPIIHVPEECDLEGLAAWDVQLTEPGGDGSTVTFKGRKAFEWLMEHHPPSDEDMATHEKEMDEWRAKVSAGEKVPEPAPPPYDSITFAPAIISACLQDPQLTPVQVSELLDEWSFAEAMTMFTTALEISQGSQIASLGKGFGGIRNS